MHRIPDTKWKHPRPWFRDFQTSLLFLYCCESFFYFFFFFFNHSVRVDRAHDGHLLGVPFKPDSLSPVSHCKCIQLRAPPLPQCSVQNESIKDKRHSNRVARTLQLHFCLLFIPSWVLLRAQAFNTQNRTELTTLKIMRDE